MNIIVLTAILVFWSVPSFGYIDPGSGSLLIQFLLGLAVGTAFTLKVWRMKVAERLKRASAQNKKKPPQKLSK